MNLTDFPIDIIHFVSEMTNFSTEDPQNLTSALALTPPRMNIYKTL